MRKAPLVVLAQRLVAGKQLEGPQQQFGEIDDTLTPASLFIERKVLDLATHELVVGLDLVRPRALLFGCVDDRLQLARREALLVDAVRLVHTLDQRQLVLHVHDLEQLRQSGIAVMRAQHAVA